MFNVYLFSRIMSKWHCSTFILCSPPVHITEVTNRIYTKELVKFGIFDNGIKNPANIILQYFTIRKIRTISFLTFFHRSKHFTIMTRHGYISNGYQIIISSKYRIQCLSRNSLSDIILFIFHYRSPTPYYLSPNAQTCYNMLK